MKPLYVCFLPWLRLDRVQTFGPLTLQPWEVANPFPDPGQSPEVVETVRAILSTYWERRQLPISRLTVIQWEDGSIIRADSPDLDLLASAMRLITFGAMCENDYFTHGTYFNSADFEWRFHTFTPGAEHISTKTRRRESSYLDAWSIDETLVLRPLVAGRSVGAGVAWNDALMKSLKAVLNGQAGQLGEKLTASIASFVVANTDLPIMTLRMEALQLAAAWESLLSDRANSYKAEGMGPAIGEVLTQVFAGCDSSVLLGYKSFAGPIVDWPWKKVWAENFWHYRNKIAHGNKVEPARYQFAEWQLIFVATVLFVLVTKLLLHAEKLYSLSDDDQDRCNAIDQVLASDKGQWPTSWRESKLSAMRRSPKMQAALDELSIKKAPA